MSKEGSVHELEDDLDKEVFIYNNREEPEDFINIFIVIEARSIARREATNESRKYIIIKEPETYPMRSPTTIKYI